MPHPQSTLKRENTHGAYSTSRSPEGYSPRVSSVQIPIQRSNPRYSLYLLNPETTWKSTNHDLFTPHHHHHHHSIHSYSRSPPRFQHCAPPLKHHNPPPRRRHFLLLQQPTHQTYRRRRMRCRPPRPPSCPQRLRRPVLVRPACRAQVPGPLVEHVLLD